MKEIYSVKKLTDGMYQDDIIMQAMSERVHGNITRHYERDALLYCHEPKNLKVSFFSSFSYSVKDDRVNGMMLDFIVDEPNEEMLEIFRFVCCHVFTLNDFRIGSIDNNQRGHVYYAANDLFSMAYLMHALESASIGLKSVFEIVDDSMPVVSGEENNEFDEDEYEYSEDIVFDEHHVAYSKDGRGLLYARSDFHETSYDVPDGVVYIQDYAFLCC